jgi:hypothetical protein
MNQMLFTTEAQRHREKRLPFRETLNNSFPVIASAVAFSHEAEGRGGKQFRTPAESTHAESPRPCGLAMTDKNQRIKAESAALEMISSRHSRYAASAALSASSGTTTSE